MYINNPKGLGKKVVEDRQKVKTSSEIQKLRMQAGSRSGQAEWSGRLEVRAGRLARQAGMESRKTGLGHNRED